MEVGVSLCFNENELRFEPRGQFLLHYLAMGNVPCSSNASNLILLVTLKWKIIDGVTCSFISSITDRK